eukprot:PhF_6_TR34084/c0_g1_i1/m.49807
MESNYVDVCNRACTLPGSIRQKALEIGRIEFRFRNVMERIVIATEGAISTHRLSDGTTEHLIRMLEEEALDLCIQKEILCDEMVSMTKSLREDAAALLVKLE